MKSLLSIVMSTLLLAGCLTTEVAKRGDTAPMASETNVTSAISSESHASAVTCSATPTDQGKPAKSQGQRAAKAKASAVTGKAGRTKASAADSPCTDVPAVSAAARTPVEAVPTSGAKREVKGINNWTGYIQGIPAAGSKFNSLKIGMGEKEAVDLAGQPTDKQSRITGKAFIPFFAGSGAEEMYYYYKGQGRLLFASNGGFSSGGSLTGIEYDATERGYSR